MCSASKLGGVTNPMHGTLRMLHASMSVGYWTVQLKLFEVVESYYPKGFSRQRPVFAWSSITNSDSPLFSNWCEYEDPVCGC